MINDFGMITVGGGQGSANITNDALVAINDMPSREKKHQPRKHKNSTSSISSVSTTIKKVAIELQNSTANFVSSTATDK